MMRCFVTREAFEVQKQELNYLVMRSMLRKQMKEFQLRMTEQRKENVID